MENDREKEPISKIKRERSPGYPYLPLGECIDLAAKLNRAARTSEVLVKDLAEPWGLSSGVGSVLRYVAAVSAFGLVDASGSGESRKIKVSDAGRRILEDERPGIRDSLCSEAALRPSLIREIYVGGEGRQGWGKNRPSDNIALSNLKFDFGFTPDGAKRFLSVYDDTVQFIMDDINIDEVDTVPINSNEQVKEPSVVSGLALGAAIQQPSSPSREAGIATQSSASQESMNIAERVVYIEEGAPGQYLKLVASGELDDYLLEAIEDFVKRQRKRLAKTLGSSSPRKLEDLI